MQGIYFDCGPVAYVHVGKVFSFKNFVYYVRWMPASHLYNGRDRKNDPNDLCWVIRLVIFLGRWLVYWSGSLILSLENHHGLGPWVCEVFLSMAGDDVAKLRQILCVSVCVCALRGWKVLHSLHDFTATTKAGCFTVLGHETVCFACTWVSWGLRRWKLSQAAFSWTWVNMILLLEWRGMQAVFFIGEICSRRICEVLTEFKTDLYREKVNPHAFG